MTVPLLGLLTPVIDSGSPLGSVSLASSAEAAIESVVFMVATNPLSLLATGGSALTVSETFAEAVPPWPSVIA